MAWKHAEREARDRFDARVVAIWAGETIEAPPEALARLALDVATQQRQAAEAAQNAYVEAVTAARA